MFKLFTSRLPREKIADSEYCSSNFLPYLSHWDNNTLFLEGNRLMSIVKVSGFSFETADDEDLESKVAIRNMLLKGMAAGGLSLYFHLVRRKHKPYPDDYVSAEMPDGFASYLDQRWRDKYQDKRAFINELYISVVKKADVDSTSVEGFVKKIISGSQKSYWEEGMKEAFENLGDAVGRIFNTLREYSPKILSTYKIGHTLYSEPAEFLYRLSNFGEKQRIMYVPDDMRKFIVNTRMYFGKRAIEGKMQNGKSKFAGMVSLKEYGPKTWPGMFDGFLQLPFEFIMTQSFQFTNKQLAINSMQLQQNRMIQSEDKAVSQVIQISEALDKAMSGEIGFGKHHLSIMCMGDSLKELDNNLSIAAVELTNSGSIGVREKINMEPAYWAQMPGNYDYIARLATINTLNLASFVSLHNYPTGKEFNNFWGSAVTVLDTTSETPYYFNFHLRDVGHTTIIGPTGAGKTVLMNFLCAQMQKFGCRLFFFDKDRGAEIFLRALNGIYTIIDPGKSCHFNPLQLDDTPQNRTFLLEWMSLLVSVHGEPISAEDMALLERAIEGNYKLDKQDRRLSNIVPFLGLEGPGTLAGRIAMWWGNGSHAPIFDNDSDNIDFTKSNIFGFEMAALLQDKSSLGPVLAYLFHRINMSLDGTRSMIVLDEAWALIDNPIFAPKIKDWLKVLRKLNTFVVFATQSVEDASKSSISDTLIQQTATQIFLPNLKATQVYRTAFMLTQREFDLVKQTDPGSRYFLVKQGNDAVIARVDLSSMPDVISVLSGRVDTVIILDEVRAEYGDDPEAWIPEFIRRVQSKKD